MEEPTPTTHNENTTDQTLPDLDPEEFAFALAYISTMGNATQAAIDAKLVPADDRRIAAKRGWQMMQRPHVKTGIAVLTAQEFSAERANKAAILKPLLAAVIFNRAEAYYPGTSDLRPPSEWPLAGQLCLQQLEKEPVVVTTKEAGPIIVGHKVKARWTSQENAAKILAELINLAKATDLKVTVSHILESIDQGKTHAANPTDS